MSKIIYCFFALMLLIPILSSAIVIDQATVKETEIGNIVITDNENNTIVEINYTVPRNIFTNEENSISAAVQVQRPPFSKIQLLTYLTEEGEQNISCEKNLVCGLERGNIAIKHETPGLYSYILVTAPAFMANYSITSIVNNDETINITQEGEDFVIVKSIVLKAIDRKENVGPINYIRREDDMRAAIARMFEQSDQATIDTYLERSEMAAKGLIVEKPEPAVKDGISTYTITVKPKKDRMAEKVNVYEHVPKIVAENVDELTFNGKSIEEYKSYIKDKYGQAAYFQIIEADPLMVWHFEAVEEEIELQYEVGKEVNSAETGSTLVTAEKTKSTLEWWKSYWFAIIVIVVVVPTMIYFSRFQKSKKTEVDINVEIDENKKNQEHIEVDADKKTYSGGKIRDEKTVKLEIYIKERLQKGHRKEDIKNDILKDNWPEHLVEEIFSKLK